MAMPKCPVETGASSEAKHRPWRAPEASVDRFATEVGEQEAG
ncbi:hypothetical protein [Nioella halotolerans]